MIPVWRRQATLDVYAGRNLERTYSTWVQTLRTAGNYTEAQAGRETVQITEKEVALFPPAPGIKCLLRDMKSAAPGIKR